MLPAHWEATMGGAEYQAKMLVERILDRQLFEVHYLASSVIAGHCSLDYSIHQFGLRRKVAGAYFPDTPSLWRRLKQLQPDVIYQRVGCAYTGVVSLYARHHGSRVVWHVASDSDVTPGRWRVGWKWPIQWLDKRLLEYGVRTADAIIVQNVRQAALLSQHYGRNHTAHIPNFHPFPERPFIKPAAPITVCWIANVKPLKQPEIFVRLAERLRDHAGVRFVIAGAPPISWAAWSQIRARIEGLPNLEYLGALPQSEVNALLARSHILVNTSWREGFPNTFIQSWLRRVAVVSLQANPDDLLSDGKLGFCAGGEFEKLVRQVEMLALNEPLRTEIGDRAERYARDTFSERNIDRVIALLDGLHRQGPQASNGSI